MHKTRRIGLSSQQRPKQLLSSIGDKPRQESKLQIPKAFDDPPVSSSDEDEDGEALAEEHQKAPDADRQIVGHRDLRSRSPDDATLDNSDDSGNERTTRASIQRTNFNKSAQTGSLRQGTRRKSDFTETVASGTKPSCDARSSSNKQSLSGRSFNSTFGRKRQCENSPSSGKHLENGQGFVKTKPSKRTYKKRQLEKKGLGAVSKAQLQVPDSLVSPKKAETNKLRIPSGSALLSPAKSPPAKLASTTTSATKGSNCLQRGNSVEPSRSQSPPAAVFKVPVEFPSVERRTGDGRAAPDTTLLDVSSDAGSTESGPRDVQIVDVGAETVAAAAVCPWCGESVDKALLDEFSKGQRMKVQLQTKFCQRHKKQTAMQTWQARRYPEVEWQGLASRFALYRDFLLDIVNGKTSHFRSMLAAKIASGQARSLQREGNLNPGYYGPRGFNLMCDYLVDEFADLLKQKAVDDRVIAGRGPAAFIQSVLVAELAVQMIKDDLGVSVEEARDVMEESKGLGEMVHEET